jgi:hypothetical protein
VSIHSRNFQQLSAKSGGSKLRELLDKWQHQLSAENRENPSADLLISV